MAKKAGLILLALFLLWLHFYDLGRRPFHHDESIHAYYGWLLAKNGPAAYKYDPVYHGPFLYFADAFTFRLFGGFINVNATDFSARFMPSLFGIILLLLAYLFLKDAWGGKASLWIVVLICFSPTFTYFARFIREDIFVAVHNLAIIYGIWKYITTAKPVWFYVACGALALAFCTKESTYITVALGLGFLMFYIAGIYLNGKKTNWAEIKNWIKTNQNTLINGASVFIAIYVVLFTSLFTNPKGIIDSVYTAIKYWGGQQYKPRIPGPFYYYWSRLFIYEPLVAIAFIGALFKFINNNISKYLIILGTLGIYAFSIAEEYISLLNVSWIKTGVGFLSVIIFIIAFALISQKSIGNRKNCVMFFLIYWSLSNLFAYSFAQEKVPWLLVHILLPMSLLGAVFWAESLQDIKKWSKKVALVCIAFLLAFEALASYRLNFIDGANPCETLVYTQTTWDVVKKANQVKEILAKLNRKSALGLIYIENEVSWPLVWYLRDYPVNYSKPSPQEAKEALAIFADLGNQSYYQKNLAGLFSEEHLPLRAWWIADRHKMNLSNIITFLFTRKTFNPTGSSDFLFYLRKDYSSLPPVRGVSLTGGGPPSGEVRGVNLTPQIIKPQKIFGSKGGGKGQFDLPRGLSCDNEGIWIADSRNSRIEKFSWEGKFLKSLGKEGNRYGEFKEPCGLALDKEGNIYVADTWNHRIQKFNPKGEFLLQWQDNFYGPRCVVIDDAKKIIYVSDTGNCLIKKYNLEGNSLGSFGGRGQEPGKFWEPIGLALDKNGNIWVADTWNQRIQCLNPKGKALKLWDVPGWYGPYLREPYIAIYKENVIVTDSAIHRILVFNMDGKLIKIIGKLGRGEGEFNTPVGITLGKGGLVVGEAGGCRVQIFPLTLFSY